MQKKGYRQTEEHKRKIRKGNKGKKLSEETKRKISEANEGEKAYWYGKRLSKKIKKKMSEAHKNKHHSKETKRKMSESHKGKKSALRCHWKLSEETKRKIGESHRGEKNGMFGRTGENNPNWNGGSSFESYPQEFTKSLKEIVKIINNFECVLCRMNERAHIKKYGKRICVHHINYNKKNCNMGNLTILCISCNSKVNKNREYWKDFLRRKDD